MTWLRIETFEDPTGLHGTNYTKYEPRLLRFETKNNEKMKTISIDWISIVNYHLLLLLLSFWLQPNLNRCFPNIMNDSFRTETNYWFEVYFANGKLCVSNRTSSNKTEMHVFNTHFETKRWYQIALTHEQSLFRKASLSFYLDGEFIETVPFPYPKYDEPVSRCYIATNEELFQVRMRKKEKERRERKKNNHQTKQLEITLDKGKLERAKISTILWTARSYRDYFRRNLSSRHYETIPTRAELSPETKLR